MKLNHINKMEEHIENDQKVENGNIGHVQVTIEDPEPKSKERALSLKVEGNLLYTSEGYEEVGIIRLSRNTVRLWNAFLLMNFKTQRRSTQISAYAILSFGNGRMRLCTLTERSN